MTYPVINTTKTGANIKRFRIESKLSISEVQECFGFRTPQAVYKWERGLSIPSIDNLVLLSRMFQTTIDEILVIEESEC